MPFSSTSFNYPFIVAGLNEAVNACSFISLVFFFLLLSVMCRRRSDVYLFGVPFIVGVFLVTDIRLLFMAVPEMFQMVFFKIMWASYLAVAVWSLIFGIVSLKDWWKFWKAKGNSDVVKVLVPCFGLVSEHTSNQFFSRRFLLLILTGAIMGGITGMMRFAIAVPEDLQQMIWNLLYREWVDHILLGILIHQVLQLLPLVLFMLLIAFVIFNDNHFKFEAKALRLKLICSGVALAFGFGMAFIYFNR